MIETIKEQEEAEGCKRDKKAICPYLKEFLLVHYDILHYRVRRAETNIKSV